MGLHTTRNDSKVTPCVGVWIETNKVGTLAAMLRHTLRGCVDWNRGVWWNDYQGSSHPAWVCGLKHHLTDCTTFQRRSHPAWVCGLKPGLRTAWFLGGVTPCVGVWIETGGLPQLLEAAESHPAWVCGLKHRIASKRGGRFRHTLRGCIWIEALFTRWSSLWKNCKHSASCVFLFKLL